MENNMNLKHFNKAELFDLLAHNEKNIRVLLDNYFKEIYIFIRKMRKAVNSENVESLARNAQAVAKASKSVCFELMNVMAIEIETMDITKTNRMLDFIDEMENELEVLKDIISRDL
ncbi:MAG: hypothetical protein JXR36_14815 [Bacteroidales bacterium]|nr:hypothetical protein [Bacteroidales bacterium]